MNSEPSPRLRNSLIEKAKNKQENSRKKVNSDVRETVDMIFPLQKSINDDFSLCLVSWASYKLIFGDHALFLTLPLSLLPVRNEEQ